jgi:hypothetical protein
MVRISLPLLLATFAIATTARVIPLRRRSTNQTPHVLTYRDIVEARNPWLPG